MENVKELDEMTMAQVISVLQDHEGRITANEKGQEHLEKNFDEIKNLIQKGNDEQAERLKIIDNRLMDEYFYKQRSTHDTKMSLWAKVVGGLVGGGSFLYILFEKIFTQLL